MRDWNVVVTAKEHHFAEALKLLKTFGETAKTDYFNVLTIKVEDIGQFLQQLHRLLREEPLLCASISRVLPVTTIFKFQTHDEFEAKAKQAVIPWAETLAGSRFHVRMHRRGFKGRMGSQNEECFLDHILMQYLSEHGATAEIVFNDPDFIIAVETIGQQAGLSLWSRDELQRYPLIRLD